MTYRAEVVQSDVLMDAVRVMLGRRAGDRRGEYVTEIASDGVIIQEVAEGTMGPTLLVPTEAARALLDALSRYFGGTSDTRQLRRDYDAERSRVDKLADALITVATMAPTVEYRTDVR